MYRYEFCAERTVAGRLVLVGDAAHHGGPHTATGAHTAFLDGIYLLEAFRPVVMETAAAAAAAADATAAAGAGGGGGGDSSSSRSSSGNSSSSSSSSGNSNAVWGGVLDRALAAYGPPSLTRARWLYDRSVSMTRATVMPPGWSSEASRMPLTPERILGVVVVVGGESSSSTTNTATTKEGMTAEQLRGELLARRVPPSEAGPAKTKEELATALLAFCPAATASSRAIPPAVF
jgi:hypothetical protein